VQANISKQKAGLQKHAVVVKTKQKELQTATLELGMFCADLLVDGIGKRACTQSKSKRTSRTRTRPGKKHSQALQNCMQNWQRSKDS
jgi:hypothetical protein